MRGRKISTVGEGAECKKVLLEKAWSENMLHWRRCGMKTCLVGGGEEWWTIFFIFATVFSGNEIGVLGEGTQCLNWL